MNNNTIGTYIWLALTALMVGVLLLADGGGDAVTIDATIADLQVQAATLISTPPQIPTPNLDGIQWPTGIALPMLIVGAALALLVAMCRSSGGSSVLSARRHLPFQYQVQAKDLDAS